MKPIPTAVFTAEAKGPLTLVWILYPLGPGEWSPITHCRHKDCPDGELFEIEFFNLGFNELKNFLLLKAPGAKELVLDGLRTTDEMTLFEMRDGRRKRQVLSIYRAR